MSNTKAGNQTPHDAGTSSNLPPEIRDKAKLRSQVIAWSSLDPNLSSEMHKYFCCRTFGPFLIMPCFWPHLFCMWPCLCSAKVAGVETAKSQWWILTETELKIFIGDHDVTCIPGCCRTGDVVQTIPLENITDCGVDARGGGAMNNCMGDLPIIYVDTASSNNAGENGKRHEAEGVALKNYDWLVNKIMDQRDWVKGHNREAMNSYAVPVEAEIMMDGRDNKPVEKRIEEAKKLRDNGIISEEEFQKKRQEIIASI